MTRAVVLLVIRMCVTVGISTLRRRN